MNDRLKKWVCPAPFKDMMILNTRVSACCPEWLVPERKNDFIYNDVLDLKKYWEGDALNELRKTVSDGSYSMCDTKMCPRIQTVLNMSDNEFDILINEGAVWNVSQYDEKFDMPENVYLNFDEACNLKCRTCRVSQITNQNYYKKNEVLMLMDTFEKQFASTVETICLNGAGDVFYTRSGREWLQNFKAEKYPNLKNVNIITNGLLFTEKMWNSMKDVQPYIKHLFVSVDAATEETYKSVRGGDWNILMDNIEFWKTLGLETLQFNMVVQKKNQNEVYDFYKFFAEKCMDGNIENFRCEITMLQDWGHLSKEEFESMLPDKKILEKQILKLRPFVGRLNSNLW